MIKIDTIKVGERKDYQRNQEFDELSTHVEINGSGEIIKEEIKTLLDHCKKDDDLRIIVIHAIMEVLHDN